MMVLEPLTGVAQCTVAGSCEGGGKPACEALAEDWAVQIIHDAFRSVESGEAGHSRGTMVKTGSDEAAVTNEGAEAVASPLGVLKDCSLAASAVDPVSLSLSESDWMGALLASSSPAQLGARLAWGISRGYKFQGLHRVSSYAKPFASNEATPSFRGLFPLPVSFEAMSHWAWPLGDFSPEQCRSAWLQLVAAALNDLYGMSPPYPSHRRGKMVKKVLDTLRDRVDRFLSQGVEVGISFDAVWGDISKKQINYTGEEVAIAQCLTVDQVLKSLPPLGHGGSVELAPLLEGRTRFLIEHPEPLTRQLGTRRRSTS